MSLVEVVGALALTWVLLRAMWLLVHPPRGSAQH